MRLKDYEIPGELLEQVHVYLDNVDSYVIFSHLAVEVVPKILTSDRNRFLASSVKRFIEEHHGQVGQNVAH